MNKKLVSLLTVCLTSSFLVTSAVTPTSVYAADTINVELNGSLLQMDQDPFVHDSRTFVPLRAIFEAIGASIDWNPTTRTVTASKDDVTIKLTLGSKTAYRNDAPVTLDAAPMVREERSYVPVRFIAESFNTPVKWDGATKTVRLLESNRGELEKLLSTKPDLVFDYHIDYVGNFTARDAQGGMLGTRIGSIDFGFDQEKETIDYHGTFRHIGDFYRGVNDFDLYMTGERAYVQYKGATTWQTSPVANGSNLDVQFLGRAAQLPTLSFPMKYAKYAVLDQKEQEDVITFYVDSKTYDQMYNDIGYSTTSIGVHNIKLTYHLDKDTQQVKQFEKGMTFKAVDDFELVMAESYTYSKLGDTYRVTLPAAAKNATPADMSKFY